MKRRGGGKATRQKKKERSNTWITFVIGFGLKTMSRGFVAQNVRIYTGQEWREGFLSSFFFLGSCNNVSNAVAQGLCLRKVKPEIENRTSLHTVGNDSLLCELPAITSCHRPHVFSN
jgi:hypothetical protein